MSSNQLANHIEAACWLRNGPAPGEGPIAERIQYLRSANGFENRIALITGTQGIAPLVLLLLDRAYSRRETAILTTMPTTTDVITDGAPIAPIYPPIFGPAAAVFAMPVDRRLMIDPTFVPPTDPDEITALFEVYDSILVSPLTVEGEPLYADLCVAVVRIPQLEGETEVIPLLFGGP